MGDARSSLVACLERLGGVPAGLVFPNDPSIVAAREGGRARPHPKVAAQLARKRELTFQKRPGARPGLSSDHTSG